MILIALSPFLFAAGYYYLTDYRYTVLRNILKRGEIVVVTRNAPTTYFEGANEEYAGLEYDLANAFADYLGVKPRFVVEDSVINILHSLDFGKADVAAAGLTVTDLRSEKYLFGPSYQQVKQEVVCRRNHNGVPHNPEDLEDKQLVVQAGTSYIEQLQKLKRQYPAISWQVDTESDTELLLRKVWKRQIECTVSDSNIFAIVRRYYPELYPAFNLSEDDSLAWALPEDAVRLQSALDDWMDEFRESGKLSDLLERYYGHLDEFDYVDTRRFRNKIHSTLPKYRRWFQQAARKQGLDWILLSAVSYQESHWNPRARSPTGVRGMMMLTLTTASQLGVDSRLDAKSNIHAGAKYLAQLRDRLPESIKEPERTWMALAAYNLGYGHLDDARKLAERLGKDPNRWVDVESVLPLLSQRKYYKTLKHGYARGYEAVQYVSRVREYRDILHKYMFG
jgi:membrane-bound lytic murein transglycosylase F